MKSNSVLVQLGLGALTLLVIACNRTDSRSNASANSEPRELAAPLEITQRISLGESQDEYVAEPAGVALSDRFIFVSDAGTSSVLQYDRSGHLIRRIGRRGKGPGEFSVPAAIVALGDTAVLVADVGTGRLSIFSVDSGGIIAFRRFPGSPFTIGVSGDSIVAGNFNAEQLTSMYVQSVRDSVGKAFGPISPDYVSGRRIKFTYPFSAAAFIKRGFVVGMIGSSTLYRTTDGGVRVDSMVLRHRVRRGVPAGLEEKLASTSTEGGEMLLVSILTAIHSLGEQTILVHVDFSPQGEGVSGRGFISVVDWKSREQCVDAEIPLAPDTRPVFAFRADTLVVAQNVVGLPDSSSATTQIRRFLVAPCGEGNHR